LGSGLVTAAVVALVAIAGLTPLAMASIGYMALQFGIMTGCTTQYNCSETLCSPCVEPFTWLTVGAVVQALLLLCAIVLAWRYWRRWSRAAVAGAAAVILAVSIVTVTVTTQVADSSYCRPGPPVQPFPEEYCDF
jgi:glucan phosphoethanolaminetransferase (alkaline phosphatase superfamily)